MKTLVWVIVVAVLIMVLPGESFAQRAMRVIRGGKYFFGEVLSVEKVAYGQGGRHGVQLLLETGQGKLSVHLGPTWFVDSQRMKVVPHDLIEVAGSKVTFDGKPTLIATVVRKGNERLKLRTADGTPLWLASRTR